MNKFINSDEMDKFLERHKYQKHNQAQVVFRGTTMTTKELLNFPVPTDAQTVQLHSQKIPLRDMQWLKDYGKQRTSSVTGMQALNCGWPPRLSAEEHTKMLISQSFP